MFFQLLGQVVRRGWWLFLTAWLVLVVVTRMLAPRWGEVVQDRDFSFLPANTPSRVAEETFAEAFPNRHASNVVLVLHRPREHEKEHLADDLAFIEDWLRPGLLKIAEDEGGLAYEIKDTDEPLFDTDEKKPEKPQQRSIIGRVRTPNALGSGALQISPDGQALLVVVDLTTNFQAHRNWQTIDKISNLVEELKQKGKVPQGLDISLTGSAVIGRDNSVAELESARNTERLTIILVVVLLVLIYRAPLLALIPLVTVFLAVQVALNLLGILAREGILTIFEGLQIYVIILAYGAGVDYSLFLTARYKEELDRGAAPADAVEAAVGGVGHALVASAATVICGIAMMAFAQFGKFRAAGVAIPLSLALVLLATLTFSPALLRLAGRWAFWPRHGAPAEGGGGLARIWDRVGQLLLRRPGTVWVTTVALMAPFVVIAALLHNHLSYDVIGDLPASASSTQGTRLLQEHFPAGVIGPATVLAVNPQVDFGSEDGRQVVKQVTERLTAEKDELGLADIRCLTAPLGITEQGAHAFSGVRLSREAQQEGERRAARSRYIGGLGDDPRDVTRFELVLKQSPFARQSIASLDRIEQAVRDALPADVRGDTQLYVEGTTASVRDLSTVMAQDRRRIDLLVLVSVFVVLVLLLRRFIAPLYLLVSVLFSYYATLGVSFAVFWLLDPHGFTGIDWKVAIFLFTILIAVGEDYNIFLMTRIDEEERQHGPVRSVTEALHRTGPIISSCGIIMAGTFASLLGGSLTAMKQLGFALAFGVLLDTFIVRPILVPAFLILQRGCRLPLPCPEQERPRTLAVRDQRAKRARSER
jgi:RND superfamily putative drug exporter